MAVCDDLNEGKGADVAVSSPKSVRRGVGVFVSRSVDGGIAVSVPAEKN
jgi:hypothetical protein